MKREKRLDILIDVLKNENAEFANLSVPADVKEKQKLLRALMNVRLPKPIESEWLTLQNDKLREQLLDKGGEININTLPRKGRYSTCLPNLLYIPSVP